MFHLENCAKFADYVTCVICTPGGPSGVDIEFTGHSTYSSSPNYR
jgi:hypothetical protein